LTKIGTDLKTPKVKTSSSGISTVKGYGKGTRDRCVKGLMWYNGMDVPLAEQLDLSAVDIAQLAHAADECILCHDG